MVLLLTTYRLLLSIATTRNIIANEDVGTVIETVGQFVMNDNLISGMLIFIIITIVQFLVVTKGGERVAEVGARFSLDAMPGRQMSIDGDLKSGYISADKAQALRAELNTENRLFGSLDGAMKFVKGDSIAGILISLVNLFGGIYVGVNHFGLSLNESLNKFSILTIGDGLVSQIPSLLLSIACGVYLTRIKGEESNSFIGQLGEQVSGFWKSLVVIAFVILCLGVLKSELIYVAISIFIICISIAFLLWRKNNYEKSDNVELVSGEGLYKTLKFIIKDANHKKTIMATLDELEDKLWGQNLGMPDIKIDEKLKCDLEIYISNILIFRYLYEEENKGNLIEVLDDDFFIEENRCVSVELIISYFINKCLIDKYNLQYTDNIVDGLNNQSEAMKKEVEAALGLNRVHDVIKEMLVFEEFYLEKVTFFESLIYWSRIEGEPKNWLLRIRSKAKYEITSRLIDSKGKIYVALLSPEATELIQLYVTGQNENIDALIELQNKLRSELKRLTLLFRCKPVVVVNETELNFVKSFFQHVASTISVCGQADIVDKSRIAATEEIKVN